MKELRCKSGDVIFKQGDAGGEMYLVNAGAVGIFVNYGEESQRLLVELQYGKYFGEMAIIDDMPRSATAVAQSDVIMTAIDRETFNEFISTHPQIAVEIMQNLSGRLRALTVDFMDACKAICESMEENQKINKPGLFKRLKKYSDMYVESSTILDKETGERVYVGASYFGDTHNGMMF